MSAAFAERLHGGGTPIRLWLKADAYARKVLLGSTQADPWAGGAAGYLTWFSQARSLLQPAVLVIEPAALFDAQAERDGGLAGKLGNRRRPPQALRRLLEPEAPRALLDEVIGAVLSQSRGTPLVLAIPSPRAWLLHAQRLAGGDLAEVEAEAVEDGAAYMADLLRSVSRHALAGLLLEEGGNADAADAQVAASCRPLLNVATHYRWSPLLRLAAGASLPAAAADAFDAVIGTPGSVSAGVAFGRDESAAFAAGQMPPAQGEARFRFVEIAPNLEPEAVLQQLERWRAA
jgi:hypothetical protein